MKALIGENELYFQIREAMESLYEKNKRHFLLTYIVGIYNPNVYQIMEAQFGKKGLSAYERAEPENIQWMWEQYLRALTVAIEKTSPPKLEQLLPMLTVARNKEIRISH